MKPEYVIRRIRLNGRADYLTPNGGWSNDPEKAEIFSAEDHAKKRLGRRDAEIVPKPEF